ncbi:MAG: adenylate/guanylate cyclase domain-containing protein [Alphaproteobacteria bacterium]|nr:adenylate/guanylate cyclase domain-containing protein [Alphaproteobacteria bacterium]MBO6865152.1 adenylate/guanylate cyclase domain-containing protein [Alphaproteobacteria bacterium]
MTEETLAPRRLAAILAADVVGYSRLMSSNEEGTLATLKRHRVEFFDPTIAKYEGRIFKVMGDGFLVEFSSVIYAVRCAAEIQRGMVDRNHDTPEDRQIKFRIGITLGDIIVDGDDFYGDGVNIAARLEGIAGPGGIACSAIVREQVGNKIDLQFVDHGEQTVKNIIQPIRVYLVNWSDAPAAVEIRLAGGEARPRSGKPSVAVLPFDNMSNDPEQDYFSDGITEDIITDLSKVSELFVLNRNTVFTYKGKAIHVERVSKELGVAYVVEGSVRKAGNRVRINAQLIDGATGGHLWAERYDGDISDIFALQDEITFKIVSALKVQLLPSESEAIQQTPTGDMEAYNLCLQGRKQLNRHNKEYYSIARALFAKAADLDPNLAAAYAGMADCDSYSFLVRKDPETLQSMLDNSAKAIQLDSKSAGAHASHGLALWGAGRLTEAEHAYLTALQLDANLYEANFFYGRYCRATNDLVQAARLFERAAEVNPADYKSVGLLQGVYELIGMQEAAFGAGRRCVERVKRELKERPDNTIAAMHAAMALAAMGEKDAVPEFLDMALIPGQSEPSLLFNAACVHSRLGNLDAALDLLEEIHPQIPVADQAWTAQDPDLRPLHGHPRFIALIQDIPRGF